MDEVDGMAGNEDRGGVQVHNQHVLCIPDLVIALTSTQVVRLCG